MNAVPHIVVQLVHIEGPLKGEIQELSDAQIVIGRHPECQVRFPKDLVILSRKHAHIIREGNRFKIIDQSTNGTFVNGRQVPEAYLKDGDVVTFAEGGPKLSFLTQVSDQPAPQPPPMAAPAPQPPLSVVPPAAQAPIAPTPAAPIAPPVPPADQAPVTPSPAAPVTPAAAPQSAPPAIETTQVPFAIQYGAALKSFQSLPIILGKGAGCHFVINHPALNDQQAQIFFSQGQYWIKDLTGGNMIQINGVPIAGQSALQPDMQIALSPQGPKFRFLGGGRMAEVEDPPPEPPAPQPTTKPSTPKKPQKPESMGEKAGALFKKFFK